MSDQLGFGFLTDIDREYAVQQERERKESGQRNAASILKWHVEHDPPTKEEWDVMNMGIRLDRFVNHLECERCKLGCFNHCPDALGTTPYEYSIYPVSIKVCLKDYFAWCARNGRKDLIRRQTYGETTTYA